MLGSTHPCSWLSRHDREPDCSHRPWCWPGDGKDTVLDKKPCTVPASPTQSRAENQLGCRSSCSAHPGTGAVRRLNHGETCQQPRSHLLPEASPQSPGLGPAPSTQHKSLVEEDPSERVPVPGAESGHRPHSWPHTCSHHQQTRSPLHWGRGLACTWEPAGAGRAICTGRRSPECPRQPPASPSAMGGRHTPAPRRLMLVA